MKKIDLIIEALRLAEYHIKAKGWGDDIDLELYTEALAAARELKALKPVAWLVSDAQGRYATIRDPEPYGEKVYEPLYAALDGEQA